MDFGSFLLNKSSKLIRNMKEHYTVGFLIHGRHALIFSQVFHPSHPTFHPGILNSVGVLKSEFGIGILMGNIRVFTPHMVFSAPCSSFPCGKH